jgi:hypothetical protein
VGALSAAGCAVVRGPGVGAVEGGADGADGADGVDAAGAAGVSTGLAPGFTSVVSAGALFLAAVFFAVLAPAGFAGGFSRILRTTGGSMVEDADRTNSPCSLRWASSVLLSTPSSFASS